MLDAQAVIVPAIGGFYFLFFGGFLGSREGIQRHLHALVANGVKTDLEARKNAFGGHGVEVFHFILRQAGILGIVGVGLEHARRYAIRASRP